MKYTFLLILSFFALNLFAQPQIQLEVIASGFTRPVDIANAGDERIFVVEQPGSIRVIDGNGNVSPTPFLSITNTVNDNGNERGLLGLAFHPDYANNGYFFVNYTGTGGNTFVSRFSVSDFNPNIADASSEEVILTFNQPNSNHNGGDLNFGPDGYLYIGTGDGGGGGDTQNNAQTTSKYLGKMLRIDVDNGTPYSIPVDNPFVNDAAVLDEIWAIGLRNPWRFSFDRQTGDLWIGDVGQELWEEIDFQPAGSTGGQNYGWRCYEGFHTFNTNNCLPASEYVEPIFEYYSNTPTGCSVTGGFVYRGCRFPEMVGYYMFADYCTGKFWAIAPDGQGGWDSFELADLDNFEFSAFGEDWNGELYVAYLGDGTIARVVETQASFVVDAAVTNSSCEAATNGQIELSWVGDDPQSIDWGSFGTGAIISDLEAGIYQAEITTATGCVMNYWLELSADIPVNPSIASTSDVLSIVDGTFATYQWYQDGLAIAGETNATLEVSETGDYYVVVVDENGCETTSNTITIIIDAVADFDLVERIVIGPNPTTDLFFYQLDVAQSGTLWLDILDSRGILVQSQEKEVVPGELSGSFDVSKLPAGYFAFSLRSENSQISTMMIKL
ncbi:MAG: PQQ-dependent sugar dehydrogenase [Saprospiraceae bacterium]|nr:PQQ-dependent sugar dehydrogenase [Saprospiraceae bacterium]